MVVNTQTVLTTETLTVFFHAVDSSNANITGASDLQVGIWRDSDDTWLDFSDDTFGGTITTRFTALSEIDATNAPGVYKLTYDLSNVTNHSATEDTWLLVTKESSGSDLGFTPVGALQVVPASVSGETYADKLASSLALIKAFSLGNYTLDQAVYDGSTGFMTSCRVRLWDSSGNVPTSGGGSETTGRLGTVTVTGTADGSFPLLPSFVKGTLSED